jgi:hypothetical protein
MFCSGCPGHPAVDMLLAKEGGVWRQWEVKFPANMQQYPGVVLVNAKMMRRELWDFRF